MHPFNFQEATSWQLFDNAPRYTSPPLCTSARYSSRLFLIKFLGLIARIVSRANSRFIFRFLANCLEPRFVYRFFPSTERIGVETRDRQRDRQCGAVRGLFDEIRERGRSECRPRERAREREKRESRQGHEHCCLVSPRLVTSSSHGCMFFFLLQPRHPASHGRGGTLRIP